MENDEPTGPESPEQSSVGPPPAPVPPPGPDPLPSTQPMPDPAAPRRRLLWIAGSLAVIGLAGAGIALFLFVQATGDKNDAEDALAETETDLADTSDRLGASEERVDDQRAQLEERDAELAEVDAELSDAVEERDENWDALVDVLGASLAIGGGMDQDQGQCMAESLIEDRGPGVVMAFMDIGIAVPDEFTLDLMDLGLEVLRAGDECGLPPEFFDGGVEIGVRYGDNPTLDALHDECSAGEGGACDALYYSSQVGSEYEAFATTCGGRFDLESAPVLCEGSI